MKKEIIELLEKEYGIMDINKFCYLHRWTKTALGDKCDKLQAVFSINHHSDYTFEIKARDFQGIKTELEECIDKAFEETKKELISNLKVGYLTHATSKF